MYVLPPFDFDQSKIEAIIPVYDETGDTAVVLLTDGSRRVFHCTQETLLRRLAGERRLDYGKMRRWSEAVTGVHCGKPLGYDPSLVLARVKVRKPRGDNDETLGCINVAQDVKLDSAPESGAAVVTLPSGTQLATETSVETTRNNLARAAQLESRLLREMYDQIFRFRLGL